MVHPCSTELLTPLVHPVTESADPSHIPTKSLGVMVGVVLAAGAGSDDLEQLIRRIRNTPIM